MPPLNARRIRYSSRRAAHRGTGMLPSGPNSGPITTPEERRESLALARFCHCTATPCTAHTHDFVVNSALRIYRACLRSCLLDMRTYSIGPWQCIADPMLAVCHLCCVQLNFPRAATKRHHSTCNTSRRSPAGSHLPRESRRERQPPRPARDGIKSRSGQICQQRQVRSRFRYCAGPALSSLFGGAASPARVP